jgi:hypothetical protein
VGVTPVVEKRRSEPILPARAPSRMAFHRPTEGGGGGAVAGANIRSASGNGNESTFSKSNKSARRVSADLIPPIEVPEEMMQEKSKNDRNPLTAASPSNVRMSGRARSQSASGGGGGGGGQARELPESLGRLNRWLEDKRRRSRI